jgi:hypothetical protein
MGFTSTKDATRIFDAEWEVAMVNSAVGKKKNAVPKQLEHRDRRPL